MIFDIRRECSFCENEHYSKIKHHFSLDEIRENTILLNQNILMYLIRSYMVSAMVLHRLEEKKKENLFQLIKRKYDKYILMRSVSVSSMIIKFINADPSELLAL